METDRQKEKVKITISTGTGLYYYVGYIIDDVDGFFVFQDIKEGKIKLNKSSIISIKEMF